MKSVFILHFGVWRKSGDIEYPFIKVKVLASTSHMGMFIRAIEQETGMQLIFKTEEILKPYYHQKIMDI